MKKRDFLVIFKWALSSSGLERRINNIEKANHGGTGVAASWGSITGTLSSQTDLNTELSGKASTSHTHIISNTTGLQAALDGKASSSHSHAIGDVTGLQASLDGKQAFGSYASASHSHSISDTTGLQAALDGKAASSHTHAQSDVTGLVSALSGKADASHSHVVLDITGLQTSLDGKAASSHTHSQSDITGLTASLDGKAASSHTHAVGDITGLQAALDGKQASGSYASASHTHLASDITSGSFSISQIPTGTSNTTVALGDHTHTQYAPSRAKNFSTANQGPGFASDTYVTGSSIQIPSGGMVAGMRFVWHITASKTAASTATPAYNIRIGSSQTTTDTARLTINALVGQTAATDAGILTITALVRNVGATGVIAGGLAWSGSRGGAAGFGGGGSAASAAFNNSALAGQYIGISINGGSQSAWTVNSVYAELTP